MPAGENAATRGGTEARPALSSTKARSSRSSSSSTSSSRSTSALSSTFTVRSLTLAKAPWCSQHAAEPKTESARVGPQAVSATDLGEADHRDQLVLRDFAVV